MSEETKEWRVCVRVPIERESVCVCVCMCVCVSERVSCLKKRVEEGTFAPDAAVDAEAHIRVFLPQLRDSLPHGVCRLAKEERGATGRG